jgi:molybdate/tungstate transport system substrate-binding protein
MPALYNQLLEHYTITRPTDVLGTSYDYQVTYEHSALAAYQANPSTYRYVNLPPAVNLSKTRQDMRYGQATTVVPGLGVPGSASKVVIPATRVVWGLTILRSAPNYANAVRFLQLLFSAQGVAMQTATGPAPISPPVVSAADYGQVPSELQSVLNRQ